MKQMGRGDCWDLGSWEQLRRRRVEAKKMNKWKLPLPAAGRWAAGEQNREREEEAVRHRDCEEAEGIGYKAFSHVYPLFFVFSFISTELDHQRFRVHLF